MSHIVKLRTNSDSRGSLTVIEKVLGFDTIEYAINIIQKHGLAVIDPDGKLIGHSDTGKLDDGLTSIIRNSAEFDDDVIIPTRINDDDESE